MRTFWGLLLAAMALRILWTLLVPIRPISDSSAYDQLARTLALHGVYGWSPDTPSAYWAVGTSALVALTYLFTDSYAGVLALNLLAGLVILVFTYLLTSRWFDEQVGLWALGLVAFWPNLIFFSSILASELFFLAALLPGLLLWERARQELSLQNLGALVATGLIWGLAGYIRPIALLVPLALALVDLRHGPRRFAATLAKALVVMALIVLVALPWTLRNERVLGSSAMISTNFGANLWMGNNPKSEGGYMPLPRETDAMSEAARNTYLSRKATAFLRAHPDAAVRLMVRKLVRLHERETIGVVWNEKGIRARMGEAFLLPAKIAACGYWYMLLLAALAGVALRIREAGLLAALFHPPVALWGYFTAIHVVVVADDRYHMPAAIFIAALAAFPFHHLQALCTATKVAPMALHPAPGRA